MYPLRFEPIYQYRLWGGRRLADLLTAPLPGDGPIGEAWLLSDRDDHPSKVADGPLKGSTIRQLLEQSPDQLLGKLAGRFRRFPCSSSSSTHTTSSRSRCIPRMGRGTISQRARAARPKHGSCWRRAAPAVSTRA